MSDLDLGLVEFPDQPSSTGSVEDVFDKPTAFRFAFVGVGQAGGRVAATFHQLGYRRVCAVNTAENDLQELKELPETHKLTVGDRQGAGKDPAKAAREIRRHDEDVYDLLTRTWGDKVDYAFVCLAAGGGTGAGAYSQVAAVVRRYLKEKGGQGKVGVIMALPKNAEGQRAARNTLYAVRQLSKVQPSPLIFIDNERFKELYGAWLPAAQEKPQSNMATAKLLHAFNQLAGTESDDVGGATFDPADFSQVLDSGVVAFASATVKDWSSPADLTAAIRDRLQNNVLASVDLTTGKTAGLLYVVYGPAWDGPNAVTVSHLDHGTEMFNRLLHGDNPAVFPGIYPMPGDEGKIQILAMVGGLAYPHARLQQLAERAGESRDSIAEYLGV